MTSPAAIALFTGLFSSALLFAAPQVATADELSPGKAYTCTSCHGADGMKSAPGQPAIGGRSTEELVTILQAYRHLNRVNPAMQLLLLSMNETEIRDVAQYFSQAGQPRK
jgi:cytochrome c553